MKGKSKINFIVDIVMFINMMTIIGFGFLIKYALIPGFKRHSIYGRNVDLHFLGLDRHEWGSVHLILSFVFIGLLLLHIILHWKIITSWFKKYLLKTTIRYISASVLIVSALVFVFFSFFTKPEIIESHSHTNSHHANTPNDKNNTAEIETDFIIKSSKPGKKSPVQLQINSEHHHSHKVYDIRGYMTVQDVSQNYNIPANYLQERLKISNNETTNIKLGQLKKKYNFNMNDVSIAIENYQKNN